VVAVFLRPADQEGAVAVQPGVAGFHDPASRFPAGGAQLLFDLVAAAADVRREPTLADELMHPGVVVASVKAQALWFLRGRLRPFDRDRVECRF
jgi:hypothetical protein